MNLMSEGEGQRASPLECNGSGGVAYWVWSTRHRHETRTGIPDPLVSRNGSFINEFRANRALLAWSKSWRRDVASLASEATVAGQESFIAKNSVDQVEQRAYVEVFLFSVPNVSFLGGLFFEMSIEKPPFPSTCRGLRVVARVSSSTHQPHLMHQFGSNGYARCHPGYPASFRKKKLANRGCAAT